MLKYKVSIEVNYKDKQLEATSDLNGGDIHFIKYHIDDIVSHLHSMMRQIDKGENNDK